VSAANLAELFAMECTAATEVAVLDRFAPSYPKTDDTESAVYGPLGDALTTEFAWDAHVVAYSVPSIPRRLGMNTERKGTGLTIWDRLPEGGIPMLMHIVDADAKLAGRAMDARWWAEERAKVERVFATMPGYCYTTRGGYRLVWLIEPFVIRSKLDHAVWSATYLARLDYLARTYGIVGDQACKDFPRLYRLPRVHRPADGDAIERTADTLRELGNPHAIGTWIVPVAIGRVQAPLELTAEVPEPTWAGRIDLDAARKQLRAYAAKQRDKHRDAKAARRAKIIERVLAPRALVDFDDLGKAGIGRDNTVYEAANLLAWVCPDIGPGGAEELLRASIFAMDCDACGGKGYEAYVDKAHEVYVDSVKKLHQARAERHERDRQMWARIARASEGLR